MRSNRRTFMKSAIGAGVALSICPASALAANDEIRIGVIGMGSFVKLGGKGRSDAKEFQKIEGCRVTAACDCDSDNLGYYVEQAKKQGETVKAYRDFRDLLADPNIDAVSITTPNHWHSLMTIMACQAGKDVYVQKPASHNIYEGRKMVEAARKYDRIVQATHGPRGSGSFDEAFEFARNGGLGKMLRIHGVNYKPRMSIGKVSGPQPIPSACDYDLWSGPAEKQPLLRENLHYDWHWDWETGNGDLGNMGIHYIDACRWALGADQLPPRVVSIGGRLGYDDDGLTPNTLVTLFDYKPVPVIFEVRGLPKNAALRATKWGSNPSENMDKYYGARIGTIVFCEGGYIEGGAAYDYDGREIRQFTRKRTSTKANFIAAVRSHDAQSLYSGAIEGHLSCGMVHMANISYRTGRHRSMDEVREIASDDAPLKESFDRLMEHLAANQIDPAREPLTLGAALTMNPEIERFVGPCSDDANRYVSRQYRAPFIVPEKV